MTCAVRTIARNGVTATTVAVRPPPASSTASSPTTSPGPTSFIGAPSRSTSADYSASVRLRGPAEVAGGDGQGAEAPDGDDRKIGGLDAGPGRVGVEDRDEGFVEVLDGEDVGDRTHRGVFDREEVAGDEEQGEGQPECERLGGVLLADRERER